MSVVHIPWNENELARGSRSMTAFVSADRLCKKCVVAMQRITGSISDEALIDELERRGYSIRKRCIACKGVGLLEDAPHSCRQCDGTGYSD